MSETTFKQVADNASASLVTEFSTTGITSVICATDEGSIFPTPGNGFWATLWNNALYPGAPGADPNMEKVVCVARSGDSLTITPTVNTHPSPCTMGLLDVAQNTEDLQIAVNNLETGENLPAATFTTNGTVKQTVYNVRDYGLVGDSSTDNSVAFSALLSIVVAGGGGSIYFPEATGRYLFLGAIQPPFTGPSNKPVQVPIRIYSDGSSQNGYWSSNPINGGAVLDLRYAGASSQVAKIDTRGAGTLEIDHLTLLSGGTDNYQMMQTTNTTVFVHHCAIIGNMSNSGLACTQDFMLLGGTTSDIGNGSNDAFQGYGSKLNDNYYSHIQHGSVFGTFCNSIVVDNEVFSQTCGSSDTTFGSPYLIPSTNLSGFSAISITRATVEVTYYAYGITVLGANSYNYFGHNNFWDDNGNTLGGIYLAATGGNNTIVAGLTNSSNGIKYVVGPGAYGTNTIVSAQAGTMSRFPGGLNANDDGLLIGDDPANPQLILSSGKLGIGTPTSVLPSAFLTIQPTSDSGTQISFRQNSINADAYAINLFNGTDWNLAQSGVKDGRIYVAASGATGIWQSSPIARLHIGAGGATIAPMQIDVGTLLTSPSAGSIENDGTHLYYTSGTTRHQLDQQSAGSFMDLSTNQTVTSGVKTFDGSIVSTVASAGNLVPLTINQNDTTNNPIALIIASASSADNLRFNSTGNGTMISMVNNTVTTGGANNVSGINFTSTSNTTAVPLNMTVNSGSFAPVASLGLGSFRQQNASASGRAMYVSSAGSGDAIFATNTGTGLAVHVGSGTTQVAASVTGGASLNIPSGTAPTSPNSGDIWFDGTHIQFRNGSTTDQLDNQSGSFTNPMTTAGDIIYGGASGTPTRLPDGTSYNFLVSGTTPAWTNAITVPNSGNTIPLTLTQNDVTNNPKAFVISHSTTADAMQINSTGNGAAITITNNTVTTGGSNNISGINFSSTSNTTAVPINITVNSASFAPVSSLGAVSIRQQNASASGRALYVSSAGSGNTIFATNTGSGLALNIGVGNVQLTDANNIILGTTTGTQIGTATTQKLAFYGSTAIVQPLATTDLGTVLSNLGLRASGTAYTLTTTGAVSTGNLTLGTAGNKLSITTGSNASAGTGTLSGGTVTISTSAVTASSLIFLQDTASSITNVGTLTVSAKSAGVGFTVTSTVALDTSTFNWLIIN